MTRLFDTHAHLICDDWDTYPPRALDPALPVPAGGMPVERVDEMIGFYGHDAMLLVGGGLLEAGDALPEVASAFVRRVHEVSAQVGS